MKKIYVLLFIIALLLFYWYQVRPSQIKHDCSWVKINHVAVPAYPAMTKDELLAKGIITACPSPLPTPIPTPGIVPIMTSNFWISVCDQNNINTIEKYSKPRAAIPASVSWRKSTDTEYKFCLRDKGL